MLDNEGHIRLIDFGLTKVGVTSEPSSFTRTLCGTNTYMAPEVIRKEPYGPSADWWSFGVLAYDMMVGQPPFKGNDKQELYRHILHSPISLPQRLALPMSTRKFLRNLLTKSSEKRLGHPNLGGSYAIREHVFFEKLCWLDIYLKKVKPPLKLHLTIKSSTDLSHFDNLPLHDDIENGNLMVENYNDENSTNDNDDHAAASDDLFFNFSYVDDNF